MGKVWQVQHAKARFSEFLATSLTEGPQIVTKRDVETAVLVPIEQWRRLEQRSKPDLKQLLLAPEARTDDLTPPRAKRRRRFFSIFHESRHHYHVLPRLLHDH